MKFSCPECGGDKVAEITTSIKKKEIITEFHLDIYGEAEWLVDDSLTETDEEVYNYQCKDCGLPLGEGKYFYPVLLTLVERGWIRHDSNDNSSVL